MPITPEALTQQLELADALLVGRKRMLEPQDLPGRYGRVVKALDQVLHACDCEAVIGGGWAVWRHGYVGRVTRGHRRRPSQRAGGRRPSSSCGQRI